MSERIGYYLGLAVAVGFIWIYYAKGADNVAWLFAATFTIIHAKGNQIIEEIKKGAGDDE